MNKSTVTIKESNNGENHVLLTIEGFRPYQCIGEFKVKQGVPAFYDYSSGNQRMLYSCIDSSGSLHGMRKNYGWKDDIVVKAHGCYVNLDQWSVTNATDAILYLLEKEFSKNINRLVNKKYEVEFNHGKVVLISEEEYL